MKGYRLWVKEIRGYKVIISKYVIFNEVFPCLGKKNVEEITENEFSKQNVPDQTQIEVETPQTDPQPIIDDENLTNIQDIEPEYDLQNYQLARDRERRQIRPLLRYQVANYVVVQLEPNSFDKEPESYEKVVASKDFVKWLVAMQDQMSSLYKNKTGNLAEKPKDCKPIDCKWVYKIKEHEYKTSDRRYKARLGAKRLIQREGTDYTKIFSPIVKYTSTRILVALVAQYDLELEQLDVKIAFLYVSLNKTIYMTQPKGFQVKGKEHLVCLPNKYLYGLKQAPRQ